MLVVVVAMSVVIAAKTADDRVTCDKHASPHPSEYGGGYNTGVATTSDTWITTCGTGLPSILMTTVTLTTMLAHAPPYA
ncbi:hypothetical protein SLA2020_316710 [Shorea laevis]